MLKFWKKTGRKENSISSVSSSSSAPFTLRNHSSPAYNSDGFFPGNLSAHIKELEALIGEDTSEVTSSRLSKTLTEVIQDNEALIYFIQYLETIERGAMIKFILDVKSFNSALPKFVCYSGTNSDQCNDSCILKNNLKGRLAFKNNNESLISETNKLSKNVFLNCDNGSDIGCEKKISSDVSCQQEFSEVRNTEDDLEENNCDLEENNMIKGLLESSKNSESSADALKIFKKYFSQNAPLKININSSIRKRLIENLNSIVNKESFSEVKEYILKLLEKEHFNDYLKSEFHCKYQIDVLTSKKVHISDILYNETALFYFMEFLEQENCTSFLEFWMSALNFQQQFEDKGKNYDSMQAQDDAMVLYEKYFSLQATNPLHLGDDIRIKVEESICREEGPLPNCFEYPRKLIIKLLEIHYFQQFLQSQLYFKYLSELISTIQSSPLLGPRSRPSGDSDGSSDISISTTNTLLASEDTNSHKKLYKHLNSSALSIDTQQLYDPDSLWQRGPKKSGLNFGRINALGRFETDLEPEPDKKEESRITKVVKKLVNLNEDKSKEEMAWQVAAMIVRDVTNITMPSATES